MRINAGPFSPSYTGRRMAPDHAPYTILAQTHARSLRNRPTATLLTTLAVKCLGVAAAF